MALRTEDRDRCKLAAIEFAMNVRKFYSDFNTVFLLCLSCCLLLV